MPMCPVHVNCQRAFEATLQSQRAAATTTACYCPHSMHNPCAFNSLCSVLGGCGAGGALGGRSCCGVAAARRGCSGTLSGTRGCSGALGGRACSGATAAGRGCSGAHGGCGGSIALVGRSCRGATTAGRGCCDALGGSGCRDRSTAPVALIGTASGLISAAPAGLPSRRCGAGYRCACR